MPFAMPEHPSLGLSLLKSALARAGIASTIQYLNLAFAEAIDFQIYGRICRTRETDLIGEWLFSANVFESDAARAQIFRRSILAPLAPDFVAELESVRTRTPSFLATAADRILALGPKIVGFTSIFQQQVPSLALAKMLKQHDPNIQIIFGGANCESVMGAALARCFDFIDAVVSGQADLIVVELIEKLLARKAVDSIQGVYTRAKLTLGNAPAVQDMDALPDPDFVDFFDQICELPDPGSLQPRLLFETARGCWWGEKHHCTFCGLNGNDMAFRSKSPSRAVEELQRLVERYGIRDVGAVDNILDMKYLSTFVPELARRKLDLKILYEVKANLKKEQLRALKAAGITLLQPGIESLSTRVLGLMRKGVSAIQNVQLLKWCSEMDITVSWNILWGFPGETQTDYHAMAALISKITHLSPPAAHGKLRLDRFSPNFERAEQQGFAKVRPLAPYSLVYDVDDASLYDLAYYFAFEYGRGSDPTSYASVVSDAVEGWRAAHASSQLFCVDYESCLLICDWRTQSKSALVLQGLERAIYLQCDGISSLQALLALTQEYGGPTSVRVLEQQLQPLLERGLLLREGEQFLALAVPLEEYICDRELAAGLRAMATMLLAA